MAKWGGNAYARWAECPVCALRLGYWPKNGYTGKHRTQVNQSVVQLTNERIRAMNRWSSCHAKLYKGTVLLIKAELKAEAQAIGKEKPKPRAKPRATAAPRPEGQQTPSGPSASDERPSRARTTEGLNTTMADHTAEATENTPMGAVLRDMAETVEELRLQTNKLFQASQTTKG